MKTRRGTVAILLLPVALKLAVGTSVQGEVGSPRDRPAYDYDWGPAGLEIRFRRLDPTLLERLVERRQNGEPSTPAGGETGTTGGRQILLPTPLVERATCAPPCPKAD